MKANYYISLESNQLFIHLHTVESPNVLTSRVEDKVAVYVTKWFCLSKSVKQTEIADCSGSISEIKKLVSDFQFSPENKHQFIKLGLKQGA